MTDTLHIEAGTILRAPESADLTIVSVTPASLLVLTSGQMWSLLPSSARVMAALGYVVDGCEDPEVLAELVALAEAEHRARRAA